MNMLRNMGRVYRNRLILGTMTAGVLFGSLIVSYTDRYVNAQQGEPTKVQREKAALETKVRTNAVQMIDPHVDTVNLILQIGRQERELQQAQTELRTVIAQDAKFQQEDKVALVAARAQAAAAALPATTPKATPAPKLVATRAPVVKPSTAPVHVADNPAPANANSSGGWIKVRATAYSAFCNTGCTGFTRTGYDVRDTHIDHRVIAVDPNVIPLYSIVEVEGLGTYTALDTGGAIKGNRIDILVNSRSKEDAFGVQSTRIRILRSGKS